MRFVAHMARGLYKNEGLSCEEGALGSSISGSVTSESTEGFVCPELDTWNANYMFMGRIKGIVYVYVDVKYLQELAHTYHMGAR